MVGNLRVTKWEHARRVLPFRDTGEEEVLERLMSGRAQLWVSKDSAGVTEVTDGNRLHVWLAGGTLSGLLGMLADVELFAGYIGCDAIELSGRKGWRRIMKTYGFVQEGQDMVKALQ